MAGEPYEVVYGQYVGEVFDDGPCADQQDVEGDIYRHRFAHGEDSGVPWVSDERVAGDYEYVADIDFQEDGDACVGYFTGTETMTNDGGTWEGTVEGTMTWDGPADTADTVYDIDRTMLGAPSGSVRHALALMPVLANSGAASEQPGRADLSSTQPRSRVA